MSRPFSLRYRLVLVFVLTAGLALAAAGFGGWLLLARTTWEPLDAAMWEEAEGFRTELDEDRSDPNEETFDDSVRELARQIAAERDLGPGKFAHVRSLERGPIVAAGNVPELPILENPEQNRPSIVLIENEQSLRVLTVRFGDIVVALGVNVELHLQALRRARTALVLGGFVVLAALGTLVWILTGRATQELESLASELEAIGLTSLDRRLQARDVREVDRLVAELNRLLRRLERAVTHLKRFTSDASHELRTPIAALRVEIENALARERSGEEYRQSFEDALEQTERLAQLTADLLSLSQTEAGVLPEGAAVTFDVSELARKVAMSLEPLRNGQAIDLELVDGVSVVGSPSLLERLLVNLLDNAIKHGGASVPMGISVQRNDRAVSIRVHDHGAGMPQEDADRAFERLFRGKQAGGTGAGLGLALCHEIAARHGGQISIRSSPGEGTEVTVELPCTA